MRTHVRECHSPPAFFAKITIRRHGSTQAARQEAAAHHAARAPTSDGMLNHFQMFWELRDRFPLHFIVFKQVSSHIPHEANVEQYFSRAVSARASRTAHPCRRVSHSRCGISSCSLPPCGVQGLLSDPNMDPEYLAMLVMVGVNKKKFKPPVASIKERYYAMFRGKGGEL